MCGWVGGGNSSVRTAFQRVQFLQVSVHIHRVQCGMDTQMFALMFTRCVCSHSSPSHCSQRLATDIVLPWTPDREDMFEDEGEDVPEDFASRSKSIQVNQNTWLTARLGNAVQDIQRVLEAMDILEEAVTFSRYDANSIDRWRHAVQYEHNNMCRCREQRSRRDEECK